MWIRNCVISIQIKIQILKTHAGKMSMSIHGEGKSAVKLRSAKVSKILSFIETEISPSLSGLSE